MSEEAEDWKISFTAEWNKRKSSRLPSNAVFPLAENPFGSAEILAMAEVLLSGKLTMGENVSEAEELFARTVSVPYACMVNSGSSANLLALACLKHRFMEANQNWEILIPAVCWSTSLFPIVQQGFTPRFVDVDPRTMNMSLQSLQNAMNPNVKAIMAVHVLGNSICMQDLMNFVKQHDLVLIEDTCESLGSYCCVDGEKCMLGTLGSFGTFSFYFSHHITSGEGGMLVCQNEADYNLAVCLRAHGWSRQLSNKEAIEKLYPDIDPRFLFLNAGYNLRPMEVQGAMLKVQLARLSEFNECRRNNFRRISEAINSSPGLRGKIQLMEASDGTDPAWFGLACLLCPTYTHQLKDFLAYLIEMGVENRPIISGNFLRQPFVKQNLSPLNPSDFPGAEVVHSAGFFIGIHQIPIPDERITELIRTFQSFSFREL
ncbi:hypothetical protein GUITHDRAFT_82868 [Guillardia theta CCMP2712]|uniref:DegT/DnrJ/EryC1/StrS aminotransferase n=1 Tax=Guillardia theta (strain CCMP2712) TaxID=905079 RepID=L1I6I2_GUITC|nr:hypothetical protein GUITHDRAFT_82868 [Guillardia theta CCMP2712]EKX31697.1 hypothetical protein GUITHDRAFT_82868 [Guillardia theta CCMP2712]|eukprot:XP_005818677.1 hypothetical protein GUITHDRAFT_82868 [Guillardia theta CCMP2712]